MSNSELQMSNIEVEGPLLRLTLDTEMRAPAGQDNLLDGAGAALAGLSLSAIHAQSSAKLPHISIGIAVITEGRSASANGLFEYASNLTTQCAGLLHADVTTHLGWMNACAKERLVHIDISESGNTTLIQQERLDWALNL